MSATPICATERRVRLLFRISLLLKGTFSVLEMVGGGVAYFISHNAIVAIITEITQQTLTLDPDDFIAQHLAKAAVNLSLSTQHFAALYLLSHGILKTLLIVGLYRERLRYYPLSIVLFAGFTAYQLFRFHVTHSIWLLVLSAFDGLIIGLTLQEYRYLRRRLNVRPRQA